MWYLKTRKLEWTISLIFDHGLKSQGKKSHSKENSLWNRFYKALDFHALITEANDLIRGCEKKNYPVMIGPCPRYVARNRDAPCK